jgi:hypothetical protein
VETENEIKSKEELFRASRRLILRVCGLKKRDRDTPFQIESYS